MGDSNDSPVSSDSFSKVYSLVRALEKKGPIHDRSGKDYAPGELVSAIKEYEDYCKKVKAGELVFDKKEHTRLLKKITTREGIRDTVISAGNIA